MPSTLITSQAAIAAGHPLGAAAGLEVLREGGNAIDAAVAAMIALSVVIPGSVGLGGYGGSAVIRRGVDGGLGAGDWGLTGTSQKPPVPSPQPLVDLALQLKLSSQKPPAPSPQPPVIAIDFDSCAPLAFREGLVTGEKESNHYGAKSVTVPAVVAGLELILREHGTKSWSEVSQPAIRLAEGGFEFDSEHRRYMDRCRPHFDAQSLASLFPGGRVLEIGNQWQQPDLGRLLRRLADEGPAAFYEGEIAQSIVRYLNERDGLLTEEDFREYRARVVEPVRMTCRELEFFTPPPPSGGITTLAIVQTMAKVLEAATPEPNSGAYFHLLAEVMKLCWAERRQHFGDPDFVRIPMDELLAEAVADDRAQRVLRGEPSPQPPAPSPQSSHTANVIACDGEGNLISLTATQGWMYGSHLVVDGLGLVLNHGMSRFDYSPGHPNAPAAGKRMQHNMSPLIVLRGDQPAYAFGMPGGPKIVNVTAQLAINTILFDESPADAITSPRLHTEGTEPLQVSEHMSDSVVQELEKLGHTLERKDDMGGPVNVLAVDAGSQQINIASGETTGAVAGI